MLSDVTVDIQQNGKVAPRCSKLVRAFLTLFHVLLFSKGKKSGGKKSGGELLLNTRTLG